MQTFVIYNDTLKIKRVPFSDRITTNVRKKKKKKEVEGTGGRALGRGYFNPGLLKCSVDRSDPLTADPHTGTGSLLWARADRSSVRCSPEKRQTHGERVRDAGVMRRESDTERSG